MKQIRQTPSAFLNRFHRTLEALKIKRHVVPLENLRGQYQQKQKRSKDIF